MNELVPFNSIPVICKAMLGSLHHFKMEHLAPRISFEVVNDVIVKSPIDLSCLDMAFLSIRMWDFCLFSFDGKEGVLPLEPGDYSVSVEQIKDMASGAFPIRFRQIRVCLDGCPDRWNAIMNTCVN